MTAFQYLFGAWMFTILVLVSVMRHPQSAERANYILCVFSAICLSAAWPLVALIVGGMMIRRIFVRGA